MTGWHVKGSPSTIEECSSVIAALHRKIFSGTNTSAEECQPLQQATIIISDADLIERARKAANGARFARLLAGNWRGDYASQSEADLAFCSELAFWTRRDAARMDRLFRQSGLYRDKWDRPDYRKMTIEKACEMTLDAGMRGGAGGNGEGAGVTTTTQMPFALTEYGNAERLINRYGMDIRHCNIFQKWFFWDGTQWVIDREQYLVQLAKFTVRGIYAEAARIEQEELRKATAQWARRSERAVSITAMLKLAESEPGIPVLPEELDSDRWLLNCLNCTIDLRSGDPMQHRRDCLITKAAPVEYDPGAECRRWMLFLKEVFAPHPDIIPFIQRAVGYSLTGDTREECLFLLWGTGRNGKGTFIKTVASMLGDYAGTADFSTFVRSRNEGGPRDDVANMKGKRFVSAQEAREGSALAESLIKWVTGGDRVRARRLYENSYEFDPTHKIWLATNHKPVIRGTDPAIWSRIKLVPFEVSFEGREDKTLKETLQAELPGVLAWAVQGCRQWKCEGLSFPESVLSATQVYRHESDQVARFIEESCELDPRNRVKGRVLYQRYRKWAEDTGETPSSEKAFGSRITQRFQKEHKETGAVYVGIALKQGYCDCDNPAQSSDKSAGG